MTTIKVSRKRIRPVIKIYMLASLFLLPIISIGITFGNWMIVATQTSTNDIVAGCFSLDFADEDSVNLTKAYPISDAKGLNTAPYRFTLNNTCSLNGEVYITLDILEDSTTIDLDKIKVSIDGDEGVILSSLERNYNIADSEGISFSYILKTDIIQVNKDKQYELRIWLDYNAGNESMNKTFEGRVTLTSIAIESSPMIEISGPYIDSSGTTLREWAKAGEIGYYSIVVEAEKEYIADLTKIVSANENGNIGTITGLGTVEDPYIVPVTAVSEMNGTAGIIVDKGAFKYSELGKSRRAVSKTFKVDTQAPQISVIPVIVTIRYNEPYDPLSGVTVIDNSGLPIVASYSPVDLSVIGTHIIRYTAVDAAGNVATERARTVRVTS